MDHSQHSHAAHSDEPKFIDPVCGMTVTPSTSAGKVEHKGAAYYFCGPGCKRSFEKEPEKYLDPNYKPHM